jgi:hypothetical protein
MKGVGARRQGSPPLPPFLPPAPTPMGDRMSGAIRLSRHIQLSPPLAGQGGGPEVTPAARPRRQEGWSAYQGREHWAQARPWQDHLPRTGPPHRGQTGPICRAGLPFPPWRNHPTRMGALIRDRALSQARDSWYTTI